MDKIEPDCIYFIRNVAERWSHEKMNTVFFFVQFNCYIVDIYLGLNNLKIEKLIPNEDRF
jgi:hypothetical protein